MKFKLVPETRESNTIYESGIQRRIIEPETLLELSSRVSINSVSRELKIKNDSLSVLKNLAGRVNTDSPLGSALEVLTNTFNTTNSRLMRSKFSGTMSPVITSSNSFSVPRFGYILFENISLTNATLNFSSYTRKDFANSIVLSSGKAFVLKYVILDGKLFLEKFNQFSAVSFPNGSLGPLVVTNGQTRNIPAGFIYDYSYIDIQAGGTLNVDATLTPELTQIYSNGNFTCNGTIVGRRVGNAGSFTRVTATGEQIQFNVIQNLGGDGQSGNGPVGGSGSNGFGGGGGGATYAATGGNGGSGGAGGGGGGAASRTSGGSGGAGNYTLGNGLTNRPTDWVLNGQHGGHGGGSGGGGGAGGSDRKYSGDTAGAYAGAGGGYKGQHGIGLYLYIKGNVSGSGTINISGTSGFNGGNAITQGQGLGGYAGAGGGGAGGSGGSLIVRDVGNSFGNNSALVVTAGKIHVNISGGNGGSGGSRTYSIGGSAANGSAGATGTYTRQGI